MRITLGNTLPPYPDFVEGIRRAPDRGYTLTPAQTITALKNALRYIPSEWHEQLAPEFMEELRTRGRIYGYRFRPAGDLKAKPIDEFRGIVVVINGCIIQKWRHLSAVEQMFYRNRRVAVISFGQCGRANRNRTHVIGVLRLPLRQHPFALSPAECRNGRFHRYAACGIVRCGCGPRKACC